MDGNRRGKGLSEPSVHILLKEFKDEIKRRTNKQNKIVRAFKREIRNYKESHQKRPKNLHKQNKNPSIISTSSKVVDLKDSMEVCSVLSDYTNGPDSLNESSETVHIQKEWESKKGLSTEEVMDSKCKCKRGLPKDKINSPFRKTNKKKSVSFKRKKY